jgi:hypothetical protein
MKFIASLLLAAALPIGVTDTTTASPQSDTAAVRHSDASMPPDYRDWRLITVAHEGGSFDDIRAILGNDVAIKAFRNNERPLPDGTMIARLAWRYVSSPANDSVFGRMQSYVAGDPVNGVQFMVKDSKKYASTGGWGFSQFNDGKPVGSAGLTSCFPCHRQIASRDLMFSHYSP